MLRIWALVVVLVSLVGCATSKYVGEPATSYNRVSCSLEENPCKISWNDGKYSITYIIKDEGDGNYSVEGKPEIFFQSTATRKYLQFEFLVMDDKEVIYGKKIKTRSTKSAFSFDFELEPGQKISNSTIIKLQFWTRS